MEEMLTCYKRFIDAIATAELSKVDIGYYISYLPEEIREDAMKSENYYFNRLYTPEMYRGAGVATELLNGVINKADRKSVNILLEISPYPGVDFNRLVKFYKRFGFKETSNEKLLYRVGKVYENYKDGFKKARSVMPIDGIMTGSLILPDLFTNKDISLQLGDKIQLRGLRDLRDSKAYFIYTNSGNSVMIFTKSLIDKYTTIEI